MGKRGPKPKPTTLLKLHGSRRVDSRSKEPNGCELKCLPNTPTHLSGEAAEFYKTVGNRLFRMKLLTEVDYDAFVIMCEEFGQYKEACLLCKPGLLKTTNGNIVQNPAIGMRNKAREALKKSMACFGMTPSSRTYISAKEQVEADPFAELLKRRKSIG